MSDIIEDTTTKNRINKPLKHIFPDISSWPIARMSRNRSEFIKELREFTYLQITSKKQNSDLKDVVEKTIFLEKARSAKQPWRVDPPNEAAFWSKLHNKIVNIKDPSDEKLVYATYDDVLKVIISRYAEEIVGTFNPRTYLFARRFLKVFFKIIFNKWWSKSGPFFGRKKELSEKINIYGPIEKIREIGKNHTLVLLPTHSSNLDSIMIGYGIDLNVGLPSFSYGAGLNLFNFGLAAYFMNRLGAYRVDRRKRNPVYMGCLIAMSQLSIEDDVNSLFFPGGTRSRSGALENKLKLGLMSSVLYAQRTRCEQNNPKKIIIIPLILSYNFVFEARGLIEQYLRSTGQEKYVKASSKTQNIAKSIGYFFRFFSKSSNMSLSFGEPMDVFGNELDINGDSLDNNKRKINISGYFTTKGVITHDDQRESEYTSMLASKVQEKYLSENVVLPSHLIAYVAFRQLLKATQSSEIYDVFRLKTKNFVFDLDKVKSLYIKVYERLQQLDSEGKVILADEFKGQDVDDLIRSGIAQLGIYHTKRPLRFKGKKLISEDFQILYFYHNRLEGYHLEEILTLD